MGTDPPDAAPAREPAHTAGLTTALMLAHVESEAGRPGVERLLQRMGRTADEARFRDERAWFSWDTKIAMFEAAADVLGDPEVTRTAGAKAISLGVGGGLKMALRAFGTPRLVYANIIRAQHKFSSSARMVMEDVTDATARIRYELLLPLEPHPLDCAYNTGLLECVPNLFDLPSARVEHPECMLEGAEHCVYEVSWQPQTRPSWRAAAGAAGVTALAAGGTLVAGLEPAVPAASGAVAAAMAWRSARRAQGMRDLVGRKERELALERERGARIHTALHALSSTLATGEVVERITRHTGEALGGHPCLLLLREGDGLTAHPSPDVPAEAVTALLAWDGMRGLEETITLDDLADVPGLDHLPAQMVPAASLCATPLVALGTPLGVLVALAHRPYSFLPADAAVLELFRDQASIAISNARLYAQQEEMATRDPLTGLRNHREFHEAVAAEVARCRRSAARFSVAILDLDGFKRVNDTAGHAGGDALLRDVGDALHAHAREGDTTFRIGGDEFAVLLPETDSEEAAAAVTRIADAVGAIHPQVGTSFGVATWPQDGSDREALLAVADARLYEMKRRGREDDAAREAEELAATVLRLGRRLGLGASELDVLAGAASLLRDAPARKLG